MQSHQDVFSSDALKNRRYARSDTLDKSKPITSLLSNYAPSRLQISENIRSDSGTDNTSPTERELPPFFFPTLQALPYHNSENFAYPSEYQHQNVDTDPLNQEFGILVSEYSSIDDEWDEKRDRRKSNSEEYISLIGNSKFYTPCLTCVRSAFTDLTVRPSAINEMCRRLCTEECRLHVSLAGLFTQSARILNNRKLLEEYVKSSKENPIGPIYDIMPKLPSRPIKNVEKASDREAKPPTVPQRLPDHISIQRKQFLTDMLMQNTSIISDDEDLEKKKLQVVSPLSQLATIALSSSEDSSQSQKHTETDSHELELLKDFRAKWEIAEALAKTSAMTSTSKMKQRLAARKLEIDIENAKTTAAAAKYDNDQQPTGLANSNDNGSSFSSDNSQVVLDAVTTQQNVSHKILDVVSPYHEINYEPPRELLLYLVRMGSFNSTPKINNSDCQDDSLEIPKGLSTPELLQYCKHLRGENQPPLLTRFFLKPLSTFSSDLADGLRCLKLDSVSRALGQNNDGFVRCPLEALTWENRKFLIVQEILQNNPDIICLQEVDHYKFLENILRTQKYKGVFFPKPDSPCLYIEENNGPDGCAIFFKDDKFELMNFKTHILEVWRVQSNQVAIAINLKIKVSGREICICTTHLKARHGSLLSKLRNEQGRDLIRFVKQFAGDRAVLLCGDFNAEPTESVYSTILNCEFLKLSSAYADIRAENDEYKNEKTVNEKSDNYDKVQKSIQNEPPYTTWKIREDGEVCHTIDYIFYTRDILKVKNCLEFPQAEDVGKNRTPSFQYPSDHFSLICDFEIIDDQKNYNAKDQ